MNLLAILFFFLAFIFLVIKIYPLIRGVDIVQRFPALSSLTTKLPVSKIVGVGAVIVFAVLLVNFLVSVDWQKVWDGEKEGLGEWKGGMTYEYDYFYLPSGESTSKTVCTKGLNVRIYDIKTEMPPSNSKTNIAVKIEDLDGYGRSVNFRFLVEGDNISFVKFVRLEGCQVNLEFESEGVINDKKWNYIRTAIGETTILYAVGNDGRTEYYEGSFDKLYQKDKEINYKVSLLNEGPFPLKMGRIEVESG